MTIKWELVKVTPELAGKWLGKNDVNRKLREHRCAFIARAIEEGHWVVTHQAIAFSRSGRLLDGQHRLRAIIMENQAVELWVATNVTDEAFAVMDSGLPRKMYERLGSDARRTAIVTTLWRCAGPRTNPHEYEIQLLLDIAAKAFGRLENIPKFQTNTKLTKAAIQSACLLRVATEIPGSERHSWMLDAIGYLLHADIVHAPKVIVSLYRQIMEGVASVGFSNSTNEYFARTWYALNPENSQVGKILIRDMSVPLGEARDAFKSLTDNVFDGGG